MPRENCRMFKLLDKHDNVVFIGSAKEIAEKLGIKYSNIYNYFKRKIRINGEYKLELDHYQHYLIEATDKETGEKFVGSAEDIAEIYYYAPTYVLDAVRNGRNIGAAKLRKVECND